MPFKSKAQQRACYAKDDPNWDCSEFSAKTNQESLPEKVGGERQRVVEFYLKRHADGEYDKKEATSREIKRKLVWLQARRDPEKDQALEKGTRVEMEHTDDREEARRIAADHLSETWDYYDKLEKYVDSKHAGIFSPKLHPQAVQMAKGTMTKGTPLVDVPPKHIYQAAVKHKNPVLANQAHETFGVGKPMLGGAKKSLSSRLFQAIGKKAGALPHVGSISEMDHVAWPEEAEEGHNFFVLWADGRGQTKFKSKQDLKDWSTSDKVDGDPEIIKIKYCTKEEWDEPGYLGKKAAVNPLIQDTAMDAVPRGDENHAPLLNNPYDQPMGDEQAPVNYENGYQYAQSLGHRELGQVSPENIETWQNRPVPWREGLADGASRLGMGRVADMMQSAGGEAQLNKQGAVVFEPIQKEARKGGNWGSRLSTLAGGLAGAGLAASQGGKGNKIAPITGGAVGAMVGHGIHKAVKKKMDDKKEDKEAVFIPIQKEAAGVPTYDAGAGMKRMNPKPSGHINITSAAMKKDKPVSATISKPQPKRPNTFTATGGSLKQADHDVKIANRLGNLAGMAGLLGGAAMGAGVGSDLGGAVGGAPSAIEHFQAADPSALDALQGTGEVAGGVVGGVAGGMAGHGVGKTMGNMVNTMPKPAPRGAMDAI